MHQPSIVLIQLIVTSYTSRAPEHRKKAIRPNKAVHIEARLHYTSPRTQHMWPPPGAEHLKAAANGPIQTCIYAIFDIYLFLFGWQKPYL